MELNERLKFARKEAGYKSQEKFAKFLGTTRNVITEYEIGRVIPNDIFLQLMASKLHISFEWLKHGTGEKTLPIDTLSSLLNDDTLSNEDKEIMKIYIALPSEHKEILKNFAEQIATIREQEREKVKKNKELTNPPIDMTRPPRLSDEEWDMIVKKRINEVKRKENLNYNKAKMSPTSKVGVSIGGQREFKSPASRTLC